MEILQEIYYELGKLNIAIKNIKKSHFLLPMIARQGVQMLNVNGERISFETLFSPNVAENPSKEVMLVVKLIKTINEMCAVKDFNISTIKSILNTFKKEIDISKLESINFNEKSIDCLYSVFKCIYKKNDLLTGIIICAIFNIYLVNSKLISLPMLDISNALIKNEDVVDLESFYRVMLYAVKSTMSIIDKQKSIVKKDLSKANESGMKSVNIEYEYLIENPVIEVGAMLEDLEMTFATLSKATGILEKDGILVKIAGSQRYRVFKYASICDLFAN